MSSPHLDNYSLITQKPGDYQLFRQIVILKSKKLHLSEQGLQNVVNIRGKVELRVIPEFNFSIP